MTFLRKVFGHQVVFSRQPNGSNERFNQTLYISNNDVQVDLANLYWQSQQPVRKLDTTESVLHVVYRIHSYIELTPKTINRKRSCHELRGKSFVPIPLNDLLFAAPEDQHGLLCLPTVFRVFSLSILFTYKHNQQESPSGCHGLAMCGF